ncbi:MAG TPA: glycosyltransferase family 4 protein, partial [Patescibacteria group bacterium]|nr:glycosyltransferase family 4 protein [Patescibacteria group bacterium]
MKIGFFTDSYLPRIDGVVVSLETCARALRARGHEVYIVAPSHPHHKEKDPFVYRLASIKFPSPSGTPEARWVLQIPEKKLLDVVRIDFDIIHGHSTFSGITLLGIEIAKLKNIPHIWTYHTFWNRYTHYIFNGKIVTPKMVEVVSKFLGNMSDYLIAPTDGVKKELISYGVKQPIEVLPNGIDVSTYQQGKKGFLRKALHITRNKKILLSVGRLGKEKSMDFLIKSFKHIVEQEKNTVFVLVGDGPDKNKLKRLVTRLELESSVFFMGTVNHSDMPHVYADADLFLFASQTETQGLVLLEALASGVPVVAVSDKAFDAVIFSGENGFLVVKDPKIFAEKAILLLRDKKLYQRFFQSGQEQVKKFSVENTVKQVEKLYGQVMKEKGEKEKNYLHVKSINQIKKFFVKASNTL